MKLRNFKTTLELELNQYENNINESLEDPGKYFITCVDDGKLVGYVSLNDSRNIRMKKFTPQEIFESEILQHLSGDLSFFIPQIP